MHGFAPRADGEDRRARVGAAARPRAPQSEIPAAAHGCRGGDAERGGSEAPSIRQRGKNIGASGKARKRRPWWKGWG